MNTITYTSKNLLSSFPSYKNELTYEQFKMDFMKELSEAIGKIKVYQAFKDSLKNHSFVYLQLLLSKALHCNKYKHIYIKLQVLFRKGSFL